MIHLLNLVFYKLIRKINLVTSGVYNRLIIQYYYHLSRKRFFIHSSVITGRHFSIQTDLTDTTITINEQVRIRDGFHITMGNKGSLIIGHHCFFNNNCSINCLGKITIGDNCQFGENVLLYDHNHQYADKTQLISAQGYDTGEIIIGNNCWIGSHVVILKGVEIADNVVIGAGCVIFKSIPANSVVISQQNLLVISQS